MTITKLGTEQQLVYSEGDELYFVLKISGKETKYKLIIHFLFNNIFYYAGHQATVIKNSPVRLVRLVYTGAYTMLIIKPKNDSSKYTYRKEHIAM